MIDEIWCHRVLEEWRADSPNVDVWASLSPPPVMPKKKRGLKLLFLQVRCGIIRNLFKNINSMINGKQKGKGKTWELCTSLICLIVEFCVQFSSF